MSGTATLYAGDALDVLTTLPDGLARCCVTSPPYWGLRDYGVDGQLGLEPTPDAYVARMVEVFREVRRVLSDDGTLWLNVGDSYAHDAKWGGATGGKHVSALHGAAGGGRNKTTTGLGGKNLVGIPWRLAFALQADGWFLRSDIIWAKNNPMPESVTDRPTKAHEYVFLLSKSARYYYDAGAIAEPVADCTAADPRGNEHGARRERGFPGAPSNGGTRLGSGLTRNVRSVWTIATRGYAGAHFATMPPELAQRCVLAGSAPGDTVLDPFGGSGTTAMVSVGCGRNAVHIDLNPAYHALARERIGPMFCRGAA